MIPLAFVALCQLLPTHSQAEDFVSTTPSTSPRKFFEIDQTLAVIISVVVVLLVVVIAVALVSCCFLDFCPLYWHCRKEAKCDYIAQPCESTLLAMPIESADGANVYHPCEAAAKFA